MDQSELPVIYILDEPTPWSELFANACARKGVPHVMFTSPKEVPPGSVAFVRLDQREGFREVGKKVVKELWETGSRSLPNTWEANLYDDKARQVQCLSTWMPKTYLLQTYDEAHRAAKEVFSYPFMSKSKDGSSSKSVRIIKTYDDALREAYKVFKGGGIKSVYNRRQKGYVIWQEFLEGNKYDFRVCITNNKLFGLKRYVRADRPMASGSGNNEPLLELDQEARACFELAKHISEVLQTKWMAYDFVFKDGKPYVLEMSSSWAAKAYFDCVMFDTELNPTEYRGAHMFDCAVDLCLDIYSTKAADAK